MKLHLLHGAGITSSRKKLTDLKEKFDPNNVVVFGQDADPKDIRNNLTSTSLFSDDRLVILENPSEDFNYILASRSELYSILYTLILWFDHEVDTKKYLGFEILYFPESKEVSVFPFLDYLANRDKKALLEMAKLKKAGFDIQYFITMVFYLLRSLVAPKKNAPQFVKNKLSRQRENFTFDEIIILYREVLEIDFKLKSNLLETSQAEFLFINRFCYFF